MLSPILRRGPADDCIRIKVVNVKGGDPVQAAGVVKSAQDAIKKTDLVTKETGVAPDAEGLAKLETIAGVASNVTVAAKQGNQGRGQEQKAQNNAGRKRRVQDPRKRGQK